ASLLRAQSQLRRLPDEFILPKDRSPEEMSALLDRFCRYVRVDTQAVEGARTYPSSPGQLELGRMLLGELRELGLKDADKDSHGMIMGTIPATISRPGPVIAWLAHMDTSPETTGKNVKPQIIANYDGNDIGLPGDRSKVIRLAENPELKDLKDCTLV